MKISVVSPVYYGRLTVRKLVQRVAEAVSPITPHWEVILVDDRSPDDSWSEIADLAAEDPHVVGIRLSRNYGQHYAISAGIEHATGDWVVVMDCDLQDRPEEIPALYAKAQEGFDIVLAQRTVRQDGLFKRLFSWLFYKVLSRLVGANYDHRVANFGIYHRRVIDAINRFREPSRFFPTLVRMVGFRSVGLPVQHAEREEGKSSYNWKKLMRLAEDIILAHSEKPLRYIVRMGFLIFLLSVSYGVYTLARYMAGYILVPGYTSLLLTLLFSTGLLMMSLGIVGLYLGKVFAAVKERPIYIVDTIVGAEQA